MPKAIHIDIPQPCHENWQLMTPKEQGRHCLSCQKTVVDFTMMSDREMLDYISTASSSVCGRFANDQLKRDIAIAPQKKRSSFAYMWNLVIATFLITGKTYAQGKPVVTKKGKPVITNKEIFVDPQTSILGYVMMPELPKLPDLVPTFLKGIVHDAKTLLPVEGASIRIKGTIKGTPADSLGVFRLKDIKRRKKLALEVSAIGYEPLVKHMNAESDWEHIKIYMVPEAQELAPVVVVGYGRMGKVDLVGGASVMYRDTLAEKICKIKDTVTGKIVGKADQWFGLSIKKDIKVYPNPVVRGSAINMVLRLSETGEYRAELIDAGGRVVHVQSLQVSDKEQQVIVATQAAWSAGVYWMRITGGNARKMYQSKVVIQ